MQQPNITLAKAASPATVDTVGQLVTYTFTARNTGNVTLTGVTIRDSKFSTLSCTPGQPATINPGETLSCTASYTTTQADVDGGAILNTATTSGNGPRGQLVTGTDDETITPVAEPAIALAKSPSRTSVTAVGQTITYTLTATNSGNQTLSNVRISDPMAGLSDLACTPAQGASLIPGGRLTCTATYQTTQADLNRGSIGNTASVTATSPQGTAVTNTATATVTATQTPVVTLAKTVNPTTATAAGSTSTYTFVVANRGNVTLANVGVTDPIAGLSAISRTPVAAGGSLDPGESTTCTATRTLTQADVDAGVVNNSTGPNGQALPQQTATATVGVTQTPAIAVTKVADQSVYSQDGQVINYTVTVDNTGNVGLDNVQVDDPMLAGALTCTPAIGSRLEAGARMTCTGAHRVTQGDVDAVSLVNTVSVTGTPPAGAAPTASTDLTIPSSHQPGLTLEKRSGAHTYSRVGETIAFEFVATNTGNVTLIGLALTDALAGVSAPSCPETTLAPGASVTCTASYVVTQADLDAGVLDNAATATATDPDGRAASADGTTSLTALTNPSLSLDKTALTPTVSRAGELTRYQFVVTNDGNVSVSNVQLADSLEGISAFDCAPALGGTLAPGATMTCTAERAARQYGIDNGHIDNTATVTGTDPAGNAVAPASDSARITVEQNPAMTLTKTPLVSTFDAVGDQITYTIVATNIGNVTLGNVFASGPLPGMTNWTCDRSGPISLAPGEAKTCTGTKTATQADLDAGSIMNTARVTSQRPDGSAMPVVTAPAVVLAEVTTGLTLSKTADRTRVAAAGDTITYTFDAHNTGTVTINDVRITDPLAGLSELTCSPQLGGSVAPGAAMHCTATKTVTPAEMEPRRSTTTRRSPRPGPTARPCPRRPPRP